MRYMFNLDDYDEIIEKLNEEYLDCFFSSLKQHKASEDEDYTYYAYSCRIVIPELKISVREGAIYDKETEELVSDAVLLYPLDETDPSNPTDCYSNCFLSSLISQWASMEGLNTNPQCYIDSQEFVFWDTEE